MVDPWGFEPQISGYLRLFSSQASVLSKLDYESKYIRRYAKLKIVSLYFIKSVNRR